MELGNRPEVGTTGFTRRRRTILAAALALLSALASSERSPVRAQGQVPIAESWPESIPGPGNGFPSDLTVFQNAMYFSASNGVNGNELWRLDTNGVATMVADINPGAASSSPRQLRVAGNRLYFVAGRPAEGRELWMFDGINPPQLAADVSPFTNNDILYMTFVRRPGGVPVEPWGRATSCLCTNRRRAGDYSTSGRTTRPAIRVSQTTAVVAPIPMA